MFSGVERSRSVSSMRSTSVAAAVPGEQPVEQRGARAADVQRAGGRWREPEPIGSHEDRRHADRSARLARGRPAQSDRARRRARLPRDPDLQPVAAHVEARQSTARRTWPAFRAAMDASPIDAVLIHAVYLLNCASEDPDIRAKSLASLTHSLRVGRAIGASGVVLHPGSAKTGRRAARSRAPARRSARRWPKARAVPLHLENTAGAGGTLGRSIEELARAARRRRRRPRLGVCLDSCHLLASGYDIRTARRHGRADRRDRRRDRRRSASARCTSTTPRRRWDQTATATPTSARASSARLGCAAFLSAPRFGPAVRAGDPRQTAAAPRPRRSRWRWRFASAASPPALDRAQAASPARGGRS